MIGWSCWFRHVGHVDHVAVGYVPHIVRALSCVFCDWCSCLSYCRGLSPLTYYIQSYKEKKQYYLNLVSKSRCKPWYSICINLAKVSVTLWCSLLPKIGSNIVGDRPWHFSSIFTWPFSIYCLLWGNIWSPGFWKLSVALDLVLGVFISESLSGHSVVPQWSLSGHSVVTQWSLSGHPVVTQWSSQKRGEHRCYIQCTLGGGWVVENLH